MAFAVSASTHCKHLSRTSRPSLESGELYVVRARRSGSKNRDQRRLSTRVDLPLGLPVSQFPSYLTSRVKQFLVTLFIQQRHYALALSSLAHLHTVILTIADFGSGKTTLADGDDHNQNMWASEWG
jgi:hypothetical protein